MTPRKSLNGHWNYFKLKVSTKTSKNKRLNFDLQVLEKLLCMLKSSLKPSHVILSLKCVIKMNIILSQIVIILV